MKVNVVTLFGLLTFDAAGTPTTTTQYFDEPLLFSVGRQMVSTDSVPIVLTDVASAIGHSIWYNKQSMSVVPPAGPDGISLGSVGEKLECIIDKQIHPLKIDFDLNEHILPITAGTDAVVGIFEPGSRTTVAVSRTIFAGKLSNTTTSEVILSANLLGIMIRANPDGSTDLSVGHDHGGIHEVSSVATSILIAAYLGLIAGKARKERVSGGGAPGRIIQAGSADGERTSWQMLALDGPICALAVIFSNGSKVGGDAVFKNWSIIIICAIGAVLGLFGNQNVTTKRRFLEPSLIAALQAPFSGRTGILAQAIAGLVVSAIAVRDLKIIKTKIEDIKTFILERLFAITVVVWLSPLLLNLAVEDALQTTNMSMTFPVSLSISLAAAVLVIFLNSLEKNSPKPERQSL